MFEMQVLFYKNRHRFIYRKFHGKIRTWPDDFLSSMFYYFLNGILCPQLSDSKLDLHTNAGLLSLLFLLIILFLNFQHRSVNTMIKDMFVEEWSN